MFTETPVAENAGDNPEPSVIDLDYVLGKLSVSHEVTCLKADEPDVSGADLLLAFDSITFNGHSNQRDDATKDCITGDSVSGVDPFGQRPDMGKDTSEFNSAVSLSAPFSKKDCEGAVLGEIDEAQQSDNPSIVYTSRQRSSHNRKSNHINESRQTSQIYTEINENNSVVDLCSLQISRRRRSLSAYRPRSVVWGSISNSLPDFEEQSGPGPSLGKGKKSSRKKGVKKSRNFIKDQDDKKSLLKDCTPSGRISLKIKIGNKTVHESFDSKGNKVAEELPGNMVLPLEINLEKVTSTDASVLEIPSFNLSSYRHQPSSQVVGADLLASSENRCSDVGTSPDSEVINSVPDAPPFEKISQSMQDVPIISNNACASRKDVSSFSSLKMKSKNGAEATVGTEVPELGLKSTKCSTAKGKKEKASKKKGNENNFAGKHQMNEVIDSSAVFSIAENHLAAGHDTPSDHGESGSLSKDLSGAMNGLQFTSSEERDLFDPLRNAWVLCDECEKWRRIPATLADQIEETNSGWTCKDNTDKYFADCSIPQEKSNSEINKELEIPDEDVCDTLLLSNQNKSKVTKESSWSLIKSNLFLHRSRKKQPIDEVMVCHCKIPSDGRMGCRAKCLNRILNIECVKGTCPCGERCSNQQFQKRKYAKLKCFKSGKKGYGLQSLEDISEGQFLIEYVGEVLDMHAYEARQKQYALNGHKHFYFMTLNGSEVIDACTKGNLGRFINHSCYPNCRTEKWMVNGEVCVGLFAIRDIKKGEEVTFDYNYVRVFGAAAKKCVCGSLNCRGYIGGDPTNSEIIVQSDSDDECPEPVMVTEDGERKSIILNSLNNTEQEIANEPPEKSLGMKERVSEVTHLETIAGAHILETLTQKVDVDSIPTVANEDKFEDDNFVNKIYTDNAVEELDISTSDACTVESDDQSQKQKPLSYEPTESLLDTVEHTTKLKYADVGGKDGLVKPSSLAKTKRSSFSIKKGKIKVNVLKEKGTPQMDRLNTMPNKSKKQPQSLNSQFEAVEEKLNDLLEPEGGISKRKDASRGYLKLLFLTAASGNNVNGEAIQSNRDLSMILDALLKTKSRSVLVDIINKNGLQMLHNIMKRYRKEFNKTPILRKLLKVLEYLAMREILNLEHITGGPPRPGVESFKDSILTLTEHLDKQVHQIARNFRDRWIPRSFRKICCNPRDDRMIESHATPTHGKFSLSQDHHPSEKPSEPPLSFEIQSSGTNPSSTIDRPASASNNNNNETSQNKPRKRKSRWDTPPDEYPNSKPKTNSEPDMDDDKPPGFSSPCHRPIVSSDGSPTNRFIKNPLGVVLGNSQPRFVSRMPVSYGIPSSIVQRFGAEASIGWSVAPSLPFFPFPPLPSYEKGNRPIGFTEKGEEGKKHARTWGGGVDLEGNDADFQRGGSHSLERKYYRQQKLNHSKLAPPWVRMRNGWGSAQEM